MSKESESVKLEAGEPHVRVVFETSAGKIPIYFKTNSRGDVCITSKNATFAYVDANGRFYT